MSSENLFELRKRSPFPIPTVDIIINLNGSIVLVKRRYPPLGWALPGGFLDKGESLEEAALREAREETGLELEGLRQFRVYSDPSRDPRFHTVTTVFTASGRGEPGAGDDAASVAVFGRDELPEKMAFDHRDILQDYFSSNTGRGCSGGGKK